MPSPPSMSFLSLLMMPLCAQRTETERKKSKCPPKQIPPPKTPNPKPPSQPAKLSQDHKKVIEIPKKNSGD
ncbi:hypothetical protein VTJ04DRAFT_3955 [Mycothermus thermophilus]|uniref:uncharacterized protein n=1 Tax=Humicola insolens TaxID=85995 RepID=UPI00374446CF